MNLTEMRTLVRRDLHDEDASNYRWADADLDRHIAHALKDFSEPLPQEQKVAVPTVNGSRDISISSLTERVMIEAVEYPAGRFPPCYQRFVVWHDTITLLGSVVPDGTNCYIYFGKLHTLDAISSTIPARYEELVITGACGYAAEQLAGYAINQVNTGGPDTPGDWSAWSRAKLEYFITELKRLGRRNRIKVSELYTPFDLPVAQSTDWGP
jgi:hypothetical protein